MACAPAWLWCSRERHASLATVPNPQYGVLEALIGAAYIDLSDNATFASGCECALEPLFTRNRQLELAGLEGDSWRKRPGLRVMKPLGCGAFHLPSEQPSAIWQLYTCGHRGGGYIRILRDSARARRAEPASGDLPVAGPRGESALCSSASVLCLLLRSQWYQLIRGPGSPTAR